MPDDEKQTITEDEDDNNSEKLSEASSSHKGEILRQIDFLTAGLDAGYEDESEE